MKKLLILFGFILISTLTQCQDTEYVDLPEIIVPSGTDGFTMFKSGAAYKMTYSTAFAAMIDSLGVHRDSIDNMYVLILANTANIGSLSVLMSAAFDSIFWLSDTVDVHNDRILVLENAGAAVGDSSWQSITVDTIYSLNYVDVETGDLQINGGLGGNTYFRLQYDDEFIAMFSGTYNYIVVEEGGVNGVRINGTTDINLIKGAGSTEKGIVMSSSAFTITDADQSKGAVYAADYSANYTDRSLVDKEYVDGISSYSAINAQTGTTYEFVAGDVREFVTFSNAGAITVTVPVNADVAIDVGETIDCQQVGAGAVTFTPEGGVTLNAFGADLTSAGQWASFQLIKTATNVWSVIGKF